MRAELSGQLLLDLGISHCRRDNDWRPFERKLDNADDLGDHVVPPAVPAACAGAGVAVVSVPAAGAVVSGVVGVAPVVSGVGVGVLAPVAGAEVGVPEAVGAGVGAVSLGSPRSVFSACSKVVMCVLTRSMADAIAAVLPLLTAVRRSVSVCRIVAMSLAMLLVT
jgi:hypothetical protein